MKPGRDLIVANGAALLIVAIALVLGWYEAGAFGLVILAVLDLMILIRQRSVHPPQDKDDGST
jgi:type IV secretory pathway TrbD component